MNTLNVSSLKNISNTFRNNFSKKTLTQNMFVKTNSWIFLKKQKQLNKKENMKKGGKAFILLKLHENMGHITNFPLFPILNKTITNYKHINYGVCSKCCKSIYSKYIVVRGTFLRTYWITATPCSFNIANCFADIDW